MTLFRITPATDDPVAFRNLKDQLRVDYGAQDDYLRQILLPAAVDKFESESGVALLPQVWELTLNDWWPRTGYAWLAKPPLVSVDSVKYDDAAGAEQTLPPGQYAWSTKSRKIWWDKDADPAPELRGGAWDRVRIRFTAGYADQAAVPARMKYAILALCTFYFHNPGDMGADVPVQIRDLIISSTEDYL